MDTIMIMAKALAKASGLDIVRLDIQYNDMDMDYIGYLFLGKNAESEIEYVIGTNGNCAKRS